MSTIDLLFGLDYYRLLLKTIKAWMSNAFHPEDPPEAFVESVRLSYRSITLELNKRDQQDGYSTLSLRCIFEIDRKKVVFESVYCEKRDRENEVKEFILKQTPAGGFQWNPQPKSEPYSNAVVQYLSMADAIAKQTMNCVKGDSYSPGFYSEIILEENAIMLRQVNHMNAKSTDHRNDYSLRELELFIPLSPAGENNLYSDYNIGKMKISFSDRSSNNNKVCGEKIFEKIREEKAKFDS